MGIQDPTELDLEQLIRGGHIRAAFAPVFDMWTESAAGYRVEHFVPELPEQEAAQEPQLRRALQHSTMVGDFDSSLRDIGLRAGASAGLPTHTRLFFSAEPESLVTLEDRTDEPDRSVILQLDPPRIAANPAAVMRNVRSARGLGWGIGMRELGCTLESVSYMPLVNPSVVSLADPVVRMTDESYLTELAWLLHAHVERTGAVIMAQGISSEREVEVARYLGARLVTGPLFGDLSTRPTPVANSAEDVLAEHFTRNLPVQGTPFSVARAQGRDPIYATFGHVMNHMHALLKRGKHAGSSAVVITVLSEDAQVPELIRHDLQEVAENCAVATLLSGGMEASPIPGVRTAPVDSSDQLRHEYAVIVVASDWSGMVAATQRADLGPEGSRMYDLLLTTDRYVSVDAARSVFSRLTPDR